MTSKEILPLDYLSFALRDPLLQYLHHHITPEGMDWLKRNVLKSTVGTNKYFKELDRFKITHILSRKTKGMDVTDINKWAEKELGYTGKGDFMASDIWEATAQRAKLSAESFYERKYWDAIWDRHSKLKVPKGQSKKLYETQ
jgi:hypothetical protein